MTNVEGVGSRVQVVVFMPDSDLLSSEGEIRENWEGNRLVNRGVTYSGLRGAGLEVASQ